MVSFIDLLEKFKERQVQVKKGTVEVKKKKKENLRKRWDIQ